MKNNTLIIRADATTRMGTGHIMRCLALSQAWQDQMGEVIFVCAQLPETLKHRLHAERMSVEPVAVEPGTLSDARELIRLSERYKASWVVVDGYQFDAAYQKQLKNAGLKVLFVDDYGHASPYSADLVLNQNLTADESLYVQRAPWTRLLLGSQYVMLRREFTEQTQSTKIIAPIARKILITMGGSDPDNATLKMVQAVAELNLPNLHVVVILGAGYTHQQELEICLAKAPNIFEVLHQVSNMSDWIRWCDLALSAAGSTTWELCVCGVPAFLLVLADNQKPIAKKVSACHAAISLGNVEHLEKQDVVHQLNNLLSDPQQRIILGDNARKLVDGRGVSRVIKMMKGNR